MTTDVPSTVDTTDDLTDGWRLKVERDAADPRFVILTVRHELPDDQPLPAAGDELESNKAQLAFLHIAIGFCASAGVIPPRLAMEWIQRIAMQMENMGKAPSLIHLPPGVAR